MSLYTSNHDDDEEEEEENEIEEEKADQEEEDREQTTLSEGLDQYSNNSGSKHTYHMSLHEHGNMHPYLSRFTYSFKVQRKARKTTKRL